MKAAIFLALALASASANANLINEFSANPPGSDSANQVIELSGAANTSFSGWLLSIESDSSASVGTVDRASFISGNYDANGILAFSIPDLENPSFVTVLTDNFTGSAGSTDFDLDNDGIFDNLGSLGTVYDAIGVYDNNGDNTGYANQLGGVDLAYIGREPELIFRDSVTSSLYAVNYLDTGSVFDATANVVDASLFNVANPTSNTFGQVNPTVAAVPEASTLSMMLGGLGLVGLLAARRKKA